MPAERLTMRLDIVRPFACDARADVRIEPSVVGSRVVWVVTGKHTTATKAASLIGGLERVIGGEIERRLFELAASAKAEATALTR